MKSIIGVLLLIQTLSATEWRSWDAAVKEAAVTQKMILVDAVRSGCHFCADMERNVFDDPQMGRWIETRFIPVKINLSHARMPLGIRVRMTPSFFFITPQLEVVKTVPGSWNIEDFKDFCLKALS